jgi:transcriptional antiterminator RfaH
MTAQDPAWYCIHTAPKQESKVAALLKRDLLLEVFSPRIRFHRSRAGRRIWANEALFPGYLFARFSYFERHREIRAISGVTSIVNFGGKPASLDQRAITTLESWIGEGDTLLISGEPQPSSEVIFVTGPLRGLQLLVTRVMPARQRIAVLLEILGSEREVEVGADAVVLARPRGAVLGAERYRE